MRDDYVGAVTATLIRHDRTTPSKRALLYVHGYNDYFFQAAMGDSIAQHGIDFYALDLRKYGRLYPPSSRCLRGYETYESTTRSWG